MKSLQLALLGLLLSCMACAGARPADDDDSVAPDDDDSGPAAADDDDSSLPLDDPCEPNPCTDPELPYCIDEGVCVACVTSGDPAPPDFCQGICSGTEPVCLDNSWSCHNVPGFEAEESSCDGFDNDCDGEVDEGGICPDCDYRMDAVEAALHAKWDLDFDFDCNTYLTTMISGPDSTAVVPLDAAEPTVTYYGNANQNMGFALVDPDPENRRVVVTYSCCPSCGCQASNGLTLLYTCEPDEPGCGCAGQLNCPGFLDEPFLSAGYEDTDFVFNEFQISTPNGLAVGPRNSYYVGNFKPASCSDEPACLACDPDNPGVFCVPSQPNCCDSTPLGRLAQFTLPTETSEPSWRIVALLEGEQILGLAAGRDSTVLVGTRVSATEGRLYRYEPVTESVVLLGSWDGPVYSITQSRWTGDWYLAVDGSQGIVRLAEDGTTVLPLPAGVPASPPELAVLQWAPDGRLYRMVGTTGSPAGLEVYELP